jgi:hypothetical protein
MLLVARRIVQRASSATATAWVTATSTSPNSSSAVWKTAMASSE